MNAPIPFFETEDRGGSLPALLARLVEAFEVNPWRARYVLRFRHLQGLRETHSAVVPLETKVGLQSSKDASIDLLYQKVAHLPNCHLNIYESLLSDWYAGNSSDLQEELTRDEVMSWDLDYELTGAELHERGELIDSPYFQEYLRKQGDEFDRNPELREAIARESGVDPALPSLDLAIRLFQKQNQDSREQHFRRLRRPKEDILWAKELVGRLPSLIDRCAELDSAKITEMNGYLPKALFWLFEQAHLCWLFDLNAPCIICCGALIEEAIEVRFPALNRKWKKRQAAEKKSVPWSERASDISALFPPFQRIAEQVRRISDQRNNVAHDPGKHLSSSGSEDVAILTLRDTRDVLQALFGNQSYENGEVC